MRPPSPVCKKAAPQVLGLRTDNSLPPRLSLSPFELLLRVSPSAGKSVHSGPLGGAPGTAAALVSATISAGFHSQKLRGLLSLSLEPWPGEPGVGWDLSLLRGGPPPLRYPS